MEGNLKKIFGLEFVAIILVGLSLFGLIKYVDFRFSSLEKQISSLEEKNIQIEQENKKNVKDILNIILGTQDNITSVLEQEKIKNSNLASQFSEIKSTVGTLEKLSATDPELLKKYSKVYFLNEHYVPISLADISENYRSTKSTNFKILSEVLPHLEDMVNAGNEANIGVRAQSAYRSFATQYNLKAAYKVTYGVGANTFSADQGYSEHQLGTAVDLTTVKTDGGLDGFDKTPEYKWLLENAYKYGFIISYPAGNAYYKFEPWHWRFVGVELATRLHEDNKYFYDVDQRLIDSYLVKIFD